MTLLEKLNAESEKAQADIAARQADAAENYRMILARAANPDAGDVDALRDAMQSLGLGDADVASDLAIIGKVERNLRRAGTPEASAAAEAEVKKLRADSTRELVELVTKAFSMLSVEDGYYAIARANIDQNRLAGPRTGVVEGAAALLDKVRRVEMEAGNDRTARITAEREAERLQSENPRLFPR